MHSVVKLLPEIWELFFAALGGDALSRCCCVSGGPGGRLSLSAFALLLLFFSPFSSFLTGAGGGRGG